MSGHLDEEKLETLRDWGAGLAVDGRDELRAAGKAIMILIDEIEQLQIEVWHAREDRAHETAETASAPTAPGLDSTLRGRLRRRLGREPQPEEAATPSSAS